MSNCANKHSVLAFVCMPVNKKKSITLRNRTLCFSPEKDKLKVTFGSPYSYQSRVMKIEGYESRLYWQFRYCQSVNGATFFVTLTYNDASIPIHYGMNCFDYEDLRDLLTGGFRKQLLRKYGSVFKYFVGAELGDGKGKRGLHNNPHYHCLFFVEPDPDAKFTYVPISDKEFLHLIRLYWQGFDQETDGFQSFRSARYGIVHEGKKGVRVKDYSACVYCAKYVCKDVALKQNEEKVECFVRSRLKKDLNEDIDFYRSFFRDVVYDKFNTPLNPSKSKWLYDDVQLVEHLLPEKQFESFHSIYGCVPESVVDVAIIPIVRDICAQYSLFDDFFNYMENYIDDSVKISVNEWRNRFCNKCRISHGVGDYALCFVGDKLNPTIQVPDKNSGFKNRPLSQYYYRKLFTEVLKTGRISRKGEEIKLSPIRVLNEDGIRYKVNKLCSQINKKMSEAENNLSLVISDVDLFSKMRQSDVNTDVYLSYNDLILLLNKLQNENKDVNIFNRYAIYKLVYEGRFYKVTTDADTLIDCVPDIDVYRDYKRFLVPSIYSVSRNDLAIDAFLSCGCQGFLPYSQHPYFSRFCRIFDVFDLCSDYFFIQKDDRAQEEAERIAGIKRFHDKNLLESFFSNFN